MTRDSASHFFIDRLRPGVHVFETSVRVQHAGEYQTGIAEVRCMYAPEFAALMIDDAVPAPPIHSSTSGNETAAIAIEVGGVTVRTYAAVLGQPGPDERDLASRVLYARLEEEVRLRTSLPAGTAVGTVSTLWGEDVSLVTADDAQNVLWNGASATPATSFTLGDARDAGDTVGELITTGPLDAATVDVQLQTDIAPPSPWWRLIIVIVFGLIHGLGFASALSQLGLPSQGLVLALVSFNIGVELAQLAIILVAFIILARWRNHPNWQRLIVTPGSAAIALIAGIILCQRVLG